MDKNQNKVSCVFCGKKLKEQKRLQLHMLKNKECIGEQKIKKQKDEKIQNKIINEIYPDDCNEYIKRMKKLENKHKKIYDEIYECIFKEHLINFENLFICNFFNSFDVRGCNFDDEDSWGEALFKAYQYTHSMIERFKNNL